RVDERLRIVVGRLLLARRRDRRDPPRVARSVAVLAAQPGVALLVGLRSLLSRDLDPFLETATGRGSKALLVLRLLGETRVRLVLARSRGGAPLSSGHRRPSKSDRPFWPSVPVGRKPFLVPQDVRRGPSRRRPSASLEDEAVLPS